MNEARTTNKGAVRSLVTLNLNTELRKKVIRITD